MNRIEHLESKLPKDLDHEAKYRQNFNKYASYLGNGVYEYRGIKATDTAELYLLYVLTTERIEFKQQ